MEKYKTLTRNVCVLARCGIACLQSQHMGG